jgi:hypothetical protein
MPSNIGVQPTTRDAMGPTDHLDQELVVIVDFLRRNAERLRAETRKLDATSFDEGK